MVLLAILAVVIERIVDVNWEYLMQVRIYLQVEGTRE